MLQMLIRIKHLTRVIAVLREWKTSCLHTVLLSLYRRSLSNDVCFNISATVNLAPDINDIKHQYLFLLSPPWNMSSELCLALCLQGVTLTDLKEAEKTVSKAADLPARTIQPVSPIITVTPAERGEWGRNAMKQTIRFCYFTSCIDGTW